MPRKAISPSSEVKKSLHQSGLKARKGLGQHFLTDRSVVENIVSAAELTPHDFVVEIGPGLGILTSALTQKAGQVVAIELDTRLASQLRHNLSSLPNITIINADILKTGLSEILGGSKSYKVVANIPYYITSPILHYFIKATIKPSLMVVMMQKEVGDTIVAQSGAMSVLAVTMQVYSKPRIISYVPAQSFYPPPKVDSAIVCFNMLAQPAVKVADIESFLAFVRCGFRAPRKQLRNSLAQGLNTRPDEIIPLLAESHIEAQRRPETLTITEWETLYEVAVKSGKVPLPC